MVYDINIDKFCERNIPLSNHSTYDIGGNADFFVTPENIEELTCILKHCKRYGLEYFIFGYGSNILFPDNPKKDKVFISLKRFLEYKINISAVFFSAGIPLSLFSLVGVIISDARFEFTFLLPGSLGAGIFINAKCYDCQISEIIQTVYYIDLSETDFSIKSIKVEDCEFGYKSSIFQSKPWVIIGADILNLNLKNNAVDYIDGLLYRLRNGNANLSSLSSFYTLFSTEANNLNNTPIKFKEILEYRNSKCHFNYPSCGSVFKNNYSFGTPMGSIIEKLNLRGNQCGGAMISPYHGNIIINCNNAKSCDIINLIELIKEKVYKTHGFLPEPEVIIINE